MAITLDVSGKNLKLKGIKGPTFAADRDNIKKLSGKKPIYGLVNGNSTFLYWEVPNTELGNLLSLIPSKEIICQSEAAKDLIKRFELDTEDLLSLPPITDHIEWKRPPKFKEQEEYVRINRSKNRIISAMAPGLGKSATSLMRAKVLGFKRLLIIMPSKNNKNTWRAEAEYALDESHLFYHGTSQKRKKLLEEVNNYQIIYTTYSVVHELAGIEFDQIIADEAHTICHSETKLFKNTLKVCRANPEAGLQLLSGTPILHKPEDLWALVYLINPLVAGDKYAWKNRYEEVIESMNKKVPIRQGSGYALDERGRIKTRILKIALKTRPRNLDHLRELTKAFIYRKKRDGFVKFKDTIDIVYVEPTKYQMELYRQAKEELQLDLSQGTLKLSKEKLGRITRFLQICEGAFNLDAEEEDSSKFDYLYDELDRAEDKVIVWSKFVPGVELLQKKYKDKGVMYHGGMTQIQRSVSLWNFQGCENEHDLAEWKKHNKTKFTEPGQAQFLFGVIDRGSTAGLNLQSCARQYFTSFSWNGGINEQTGSRVKRLTQEAEEVYTTFILNNIPFERNAFNLVLSNYKTTVGILDGEDDAIYHKLEDLIGLL